MKTIVPFFLCSFFASVALAGGPTITDAVVLNQPYIDGLSGTVRLVSVDQKCRFFGKIDGVKRKPKGLAGHVAQGLGEHVMAGATEDNKITDWTTTVHTADCTGADGVAVRQSVSLKLNGGPDLHAGDHVQLVSVQ